MERKLVDQTTFYDPDDEAKGNCTEASTATILGLDLKDVPNFWDGTVEGFWTNFENFFSDKGFHIMRMPGNYVPDCEYLASGPSERGCAHMVVMRSGHLIHDPHPSRKGIEQVDHVWLVIHRLPWFALKNIEGEQ